MPNFPAGLQPRTRHHHRLDATRFYSPSCPPIHVPHPPLPRPLHLHIPRPLPSDHILETPHGPRLSPTTARMDPVLPLDLGRARLTSPPTESISSRRPDQPIHRAEPRTNGFVGLVRVLHFHGQDHLASLEILGDPV
jgi:hypothetical protein